MDSQSNAFCEAVAKYVNFYKDQDHDQADNLNKLAFSILKLLDGGTLDYEGSIKKIADENMSLHDIYRGNINSDSLDSKISACVYEVDDTKNINNNQKDENYDRYCVEH